jgi:cytochrome c peroxidase
MSAGRRSLPALARLAGALLLLGAEAKAPAADDPRPGSSLVELGRAIFFDTTLSEPAGTSCASCHDPTRAFTSNHGSTAGVPLGSRPGHLARRAAPSLLYLKYVPRFHYFQDDDAVAPAPFGGLFWDGRVDSITELARQPLLNPDEMNNRDARAIAIKVAAAPYAPALEQALALPSPLGRHPQETLVALGKALEAFLTAPEMAPFSSRFDAYLRGRGKLSTQELVGLRLFRNPNKGSCGACHRFYETGRDPALSMFTDYGYDAVAPPRNARLPAGRKPDLGLCERADRRVPSSDAIYCGSFRTPSLRNVAVRESFMHNGAFTSLRDVVAFYATRATDPKRWYKSGVKFDDVPRQYRGQVNVGSIPYNRREGDVPALDDAEIDAIVAFLRTLTDAKYEAVARAAQPTTRVAAP